MHNIGLFLVLEGADGSGKTTQFRLLAERLKAVGHDVQVLKFPRYEEPSSHFVRQYLEGKYGASDSVSPYTASVFYALDRYEAAPGIRQAIEAGKIVLSDRYVGANMAHQGAKFTNISEQRGFFLWAEGLEYQQLGIPRPNLNIYLRVPAHISMRQIAKRAEDSGVKADEHEKNAGHIEKAIGAYDLLCSLFPKDYRAIECTVDGRLLSVIEINDMIWESIKPYLPPAKRPGTGAVLQIDSSKWVVKRDKNTAHLPKNAADPPHDILSVSQMKNVDQKIGNAKERILKMGSVDKSVRRPELKAELELLEPISSRPDLVARLKVPPAVPEKVAGEPQPIEKIVSELAQNHLPSAPKENEVTLLFASPRNELDLLQGNLDSPSYREKELKLKEKLSIKNSKLLKNAHYTLEVIASLSELEFFIKNSVAHDLKIIGVGPPYGYKIPRIISDIGAEDIFAECFNKDTSSGLLLGHRGKWRVQISANFLQNADAHDIIKHAEFIELVLERVTEAHPIVASIVSRHLIIKNARAAAGSKRRDKTPR